MAVVSMKQFIEAGVHYGHQTRRWNPKMKPYIFGTKHGIHIIDLQKSLRMLRDAFEFVREVSTRGDSVLFVGTKPQAREIVRDEALRSNSFYINERWLGGLLTNFNTVKQSITHLKKMEEQRGEDGLYPGIIKKEAMRMEKKRIKLEKALGGIKEMRKLPGALFIIDCKKERIAVQEAQKLGVPIVAVVDTNCNPDHIDYVIPGNDDAIRAIGLFASTLANAVLEGQALLEAQAKAAPQEKPKPGRSRTPRPPKEDMPAGAAKPGEEPGPAPDPDKPASEAPGKAAAPPSEATAAEPAAAEPVTAAAAPAPPEPSQASSPAKAEVPAPEPAKAEAPAPAPEEAIKEAAAETPAESAKPAVSPETTEKPAEKPKEDPAGT